MSTQRTKLYRTNWFWSILAFGIFVLPQVMPFFVKWWELKPHHPVKDKMDLAILRLSLECPKELSESQWTYCIMWTWQMHSNYGGHPAYVPTEDLERITDELNHRIDQGADLKTIDWIWDQYILAYPRISHYDHYRPTGPENKETFEDVKETHSDDPNSEWSLSYWRERYQQKLAEVEGRN